MTKCDFCRQYDPINKRCINRYLTDCDEAAKRFLEYEKSKNSSTINKNVNINKKSLNRNKK